MSDIHQQAEQKCENQDLLSNIQYRYDDETLQQEELELRNMYFEEALKQIQNQKSQIQSKQICEDVVESVCRRIQKSSVVFGKDHNDIILDQSQSIYIHPNEKIEKNIQKQKLKEQLRVKQVLMEKILFVDQDINKIISEIETPKNKQSKKYVKELTEEEKKEKMEFLKLKIKERNEREKQRQKRYQEEEEQILLEQQQKRQLEENEKRQRGTIKRKEIEQRLENLKIQSLEREEKFKQENQQFKKVKSELPLYEKLQQKALTLENESLEQKKKRLAEIRDFHKPINPDELKEHEKRFYENLRAFSEKSQSQKIKTNDYKVSYISGVYKKIKEERKQYLEILKHPEELEKNKGPNLLERIQEYSKTSIKKPKIDVSKQQEMNQLVESLKHKPNYKWFVEKKRDKSSSVPTNNVETKEQENTQSKTQNISDISPRKLGNDYLVKLKERRLRNVSDVNRKQVQDNLENDNPYQQQIKTPNSSIVKKISEIQFSQKKDNLFQNQSQTNSYFASSKINYLQELKVINKDAKQKSEVQRIIQNNSLNKEQKTQQLLLHAEKLEKQALRKEKLLRAQGNNISDLNAESSLDNQIVDTYISAIKTKFALLETPS
ncbi:hypothetical protein ABPG74_001364 [Tetrahymena malaccensis]